MSQVSVEPLLSQHSDECGEQRDQKARVHEASDSDNLAGWSFLNRWDSGGFTRDSGPIEGEEDCAEKGYGLFVRIGFEFRMDIDDKCCADRREQTRL